MKDNKKEMLKEAIQNIKDKKYIETIGVLDKLAEEGNPVAMYWLAERYRHGIRIRNEDHLPEGCDLSYVEVRKGHWHTYIRPSDDKYDQLLLQSANLGYPLAQYKLGKKYKYKCRREKLERNDENYKRAYSMFKAAAERGYVPAIYELSVCYLYALGVDLNYEESIRLCKKAVEVGHSMAEYQLAWMYRSGLDVDNDRFGPIEPDLKRMFYWFKRSAEHGFLFAQYEVACCLLDGQGTDINKNEAIEWLKKAASRHLLCAKDKLEELGIKWEREHKRVDLKGN